jgi:Histidine kinase-like ATPase domain
LEEREPAMTRRTSHVLVPCRSSSTEVVRRLLARDLAGWDVDEGVADGLLLAATEAVLNAATVHDVQALQQCMLIVTWTLGETQTVAEPVSAVGSLAVESLAGRRLSFSFSVQERGTPETASRARSMRAHPALSAARGRCVMDALMDRVVVRDGHLGTNILLEKALA